jgi:hypothetical protein
MLVGDKVKYNHLNEVVILKIEGNYALIQFDSGTKICTNLHGLKKSPKCASLRGKEDVLKMTPKLILR